RAQRPPGRAVHRHGPGPRLLHPRLRLHRDRLAGCALPGWRGGGPGPRGHVQPAWPNAEGRLHLPPPVRRPLGVSRAGPPTGATEGAPWRTGGRSIIGGMGETAADWSQVGLREVIESISAELALRPLLDRILSQA